MIMVGDLVEEFLDQMREFLPERYPVLNREPRAQLDPRLWHLIHERDGGVCWSCHRAVAKGSGEIDHLVPRSSFAPHELESEADRSWNLRLACVACNQMKSNFSVLELPRTVGITRRCWDCSGMDGGGVELSVPAYCGACGFTVMVPGKEWLI